MRNPIDVLKSLNNQSKNEMYKYERLYRNLYNPEFYMLAYKNIRTNAGSMTAGIDGSTVDGFSMERVDKIIDILKDFTYVPTPAKRKYIEKKNSAKRRPLSIPSGDDKLIQEVVRMILESIYEPTFSVNSHGFRPKRSCHTALLQIKNTFKGTKWFIEGDIKSCFDEINHQILIRILRERIRDEKFLALINKFLKAGYMEEWDYHRTYAGTPQGSGVSPLLANIYLNKLDKYMEEYKEKFTVEKRSMNSEYVRLISQRYRIRQKNNQEWDTLTNEEKEIRIKECKELKTKQHTIKVRPTKEAFRKLQYVRYADDFIIGVIGSKQDAEHIKKELSLFLQEKLQLTLSKDKTKITHSTNNARFLGYDITISNDQTTKKKKNGIYQRVYMGVVKLHMPHDVWENKLWEYKAIKTSVDNKGNKVWIAKPRGFLICKKDIEILAKYNAEVRGLYNYYSMACNVSTLNKFSNLMKWSMLKTFGSKYRCKTNEIKRRYMKGNDFVVEYETKSGIKVSKYYNEGFKKRQSPLIYQVETTETYKQYDKPNYLGSRLKKGKCELCGLKAENVVIHQIKKLKDLAGQTDWEQQMIKRNSKSLILCRNCHTEIHKND